MRFLKQVPWTVAAYVGIVLALMALLLGENDPRAFGGALILLAATIGLLLGFWLAWAFLVALHVGNLILVAIQWPAWASLILAVNALMAALLLCRPTRHHPRWPRFTERLAR